MTTVTKQYTENTGPNKSTWTLSLTKDDVSVQTGTISKDQDIGYPALKARYSAISGKNCGLVVLGIDVYIGGSFFSHIAHSTNNTRYVKFNGNTDITLSPRITYQYSKTVFNSSNPNDRKVPVSYKTSMVLLESGKYINADSIESPYGSYTSTEETDIGTVFYIVLDAPPTFTVSDWQKDTSGYVAGATTVSVTISNATAQYGGNITSAKLTIGTQEATISGNGTISMMLQNTGTFTPTVTVTDSRGQTTTQNLASITVLQYENPTVSFDVFRTDDTGVRADEGHNGLIMATFTYMNAVSSLAEPEVQINGYDISQTIGASITWYTALTPHGAVDTTTEINDWSDVFLRQASYGLYGLIDGNYDVTGNFSEGESYLIGLIAKDSRNKTSALITQTLPTAFYTIDFQAGGKEIAFGAPANDALTLHPKGLFKCNMDAMFRDRSDIVRMLSDFIYPIGSYYETSLSATPPSGENTPTLDDIAVLGISWFDPNYVWNGHWELEASGNVHVSSGTGYTLGDTGGSPYIQKHTHGFSVPSVTNGSCTATSAGGHKHSPSNSDSFQTMPSGGDGLQRKNGSISGSGYNIVYSTKASTRVAYTNEVAGHQHTVPNHTHTVSGGSVNAVKDVNAGEGGNYPPYIVVNRWHRVTSTFFLDVYDDGTTVYPYVFEEGMTWDDFWPSMFNDKYRSNNLYFYVSSGSIVASVYFENNGTNGYIRCRPSSGVIRNVSRSDEIVNGMTYFIRF